MQQSGDFLEEVCFFDTLLGDAVLDQFVPREDNVE